MPVFTGTPGDDPITGTDDPDVISGLAGNDTLNGAGGDDIIDGGDDNDSIDGGTGADTMSGGAGDDIFFIDDFGDVVIENSGEGTDLVNTSVSYGLGNNVERAAVTDFTTTNAITLNGNELDNELWGNNGANYLDGFLGADILHGFAGNDVYIVDNVGDVVVESAGEGTDTVYTSVEYTLSDNVERLFVNGFSTTSAIDLYGNDLANEITGNNGSNMIDGGANRDIMRGNGGDDTYIVSLQGNITISFRPSGTSLPALGANFLHSDLPDLIIESAGGGTDTVLVPFTGSVDSHDYFDFAIMDQGFAASQASQIERLGVYDPSTTYAVNLFGNMGANEIWGNEGRNILDGWHGADTLRGFGGDDIYMVDNVGDVVVESSGGGLDTIYVQFSGSFTLPDNVERVGAYGFADNDHALNLTGNGLDNEIWGNARGNVIDGGTGADIMKAHGGDDTYYVDNAGDLVIEYAQGATWGGGTDMIWTSVDYVLPINVERMGVNGSTTTYAINLTGNTVANELWGNDGVNVIDGLLGADILHGNGGADTFAFTTALGGGNVDSIVDFAPGADKFALDDAVFNGLTPGALDPGAFRVGTTGAQDADDRIIYDSTTGALYFDADGNGAGAAVQFATVQTGLSLTASDFTVI